MQVQISGVQRVVAGLVSQLAREQGSPPHQGQPYLGWAVGSAAGADQEPEQQADSRTQPPEARKAGLYQQLDELLGRKEQILVDGGLSKQEKQQGLATLSQEVQQVQQELRELGEGPT